jgi:hypothetical protein
VTLGGVLLAACLAAELAALVMALRPVFRGQNGTQGRVVARDSDGAARLAAEIFSKLFLSPLALLLAFALASDLAILAGRELLLVDAPRPFVGLARAWYHLETALVIGWPCALALTTWRLFVWGRGVAWALPWGAWIGCSLMLAVEHPMPPGWTAHVLHAVELLGVVVAWRAIWRGWPRSWGADHRALVVLVAVETVVLILGPFGRDLYRDWPLLARLPYAAGFTACAVVLGRRAT